MSYKAEQARVRRMLEDLYADSDSIDDFSEDENCYTENHDDYEEESSDTEQSDVSDDEVVQSHATKKAKTQYLTGRDGTLWKKDSVNTFTNPLVLDTSNIIPGVNACARQAKTVLECWSLLFSDEILNHIVENTNLHIKKISQFYSRERSAKSTDLIEIKALIGLLYLAGCHKSSRLNVRELWDRKGTGIERFWLTMARDRFLFLLRGLRFDDFYARKDNIKWDKLAPIRAVFELFVENCKKCYCISDFATVDKMLIPFRGKCAFTQYQPKKSQKQGIKIFALVDTNSRYVFNLEIYAGKQPDGVYAVSYDSVDVVTRLITPISGTGRNITGGNWFTSFPLIKTLLREHKLTYVGAVSKNNKELPTELVNSRNRPIGSSVSGFQSDVTVVSYVPKKGKNTIIASSRHNTSTADFYEEENMPDIVKFYHTTKDAVDAVGDLCMAYDVARRSQRWPMAVLFFLLNFAGINSQILYCSNCDESEQLTRRLFLKELSVSLTDEHIKRRSTLTNIAPEIRLRRQEVTGIASTSKETADQFPFGTRKRCYTCKTSKIDKQDRKTRYSCEICKKYICLSHAKFICTKCPISSVNHSEE
ncbi:PiggyBac transposable element-derived protein 4 [Araneus ventricosus]|uniref:PiggyBac transposable element-derived protein 4 n=1 Tax=Araneus ventricosus TaxID=182803 RepID=A0A4Y2MEX2_ARAVE|nr:PiggyBac transposable element-derived protein 4 [Araneus ventricosus]